MAEKMGRPLSDFYPRPPRGGRPCESPNSHIMYSISIHALREEGDDVRREIQSRGGISIHALREEGDRQATSTRAL